jgi:hypothetical protein
MDDVAPMTLLRSMVVGLTLLSGLHGQTFIVDMNNRPGTNFTSLPVAVAAVPDGATLLARSGTYDSFSFANKGLTIPGGPGVRVADTSVLIENTQPARSVVLGGLKFLPTNHRAPATPGNCLGPVLLERIETSTGLASPTLAARPPQLATTSSTSRATKILAPVCTASAIASDGRQSTGRSSALDPTIGTRIRLA